MESNLLILLPLFFMNRRRKLITFAMSWPWLNDWSKINSEVFWHNICDQRKIARDLWRHSKDCGSNLVKEEPQPLVPDQGKKCSLFWLATFLGESRTTCSCVTSWSTTRRPHCRPTHIYETLNSKGNLKARITCIFVQQESAFPLWKSPQFQFFKRL